VSHSYVSHSYGAIRTEHPLYFLPTSGRTHTPGRNTQPDTRTQNDESSVPAHMGVHRQQHEPPVEDTGPYHYEYGRHDLRLAHYTEYTTSHILPLG
jgi:hypothetical protein